MTELMPDFMTLLVVLVSIAAYLAVGGSLAIRTAPHRYQRSLTRYNARWPHSNNRGDAMRSAHAGSFGYLLAWPITAPVLGFMRATATAIEENDPQVLKRRATEQTKRIAELERELGIGVNRQESKCPERRDGWKCGDCPDCIAEDQRETRYR